jgi:hypothetical protein
VIGVVLYYTALGMFEANNEAWKRPCGELVQVSFFCFDLRTWYTTLGVWGINWPCAVKLVISCYIAVIGRDQVACPVPHFSAYRSAEVLFRVFGFTYPRLPPSLAFSYYSIILCSLYMPRGPWCLLGKSRSRTLKLFLR